MKKDSFYYKACEEAKEDYFMFGSRKTDEDVNRRAEQLREEYRNSLTFSNTVKRFFSNYKWFWKESFSFMEGYNKIYITFGCIVKSIPFCIEQEKWHRIEDKQEAYINMDRTI
jgi:hypothetical protein